jgi:hypothetical protein
VLPVLFALPTEEGDVVMMKPDMAAMKKYKSLRDLAPDSPAMKLASDSVALCVDLFKLCMASMLVRSFLHACLWASSIELA